MVIKTIKIIISREVVTGYYITVEKANPEVPEAPEVRKAVLEELISSQDYLILINLYPFSIKIITPLKA